MLKIDAPWLLQLLKAIRPPTHQLSTHESEVIENYCERWILLNLKNDLFNKFDRKISLIAKPKSMNQAYKW